MAGEVGSAGEDLSAKISLIEVENSIDTEYKHNDNIGTEEIADNAHIEEESHEPDFPEGTENAEKRSKLPCNDRIIQLPLSRIKVIMKTDPDVTLASQEAVVAIAKATELFIAGLSKDAVTSTLNSKRKTLQRKDLDSVIDTRDGYEFLEGALE